MIRKLYGQDLPWEKITQMKFQKHSKMIWIEFQDGYGAYEKISNEQDWDQMIIGATLNLSAYQVVYE